MLLVRSIEWTVIKADTYNMCGTCERHHDGHQGEELDRLSCIGHSLGISGSVCTNRVVLIGRTVDAARARTVR
jgi:hypothetical protein